MKSLSMLSQEYLTLRRALGFGLNRSEYELTRFIKFSSLNGSLTITNQLAVNWATQFGTAKGRSGSRRLQIVRLFAKYAATEDPRHEIPHPMTLPPINKKRKMPYIYSEADILRIMEEAQKLPGRICSKTYYMLIGLLSCTGMRVGEAINLNQEDFNPLEGVLVIRKDKRGNTREILLDPSTVIQLQNYNKLRDTIFNNPKSEAFFVSNSGRRLHYNNVSPKVQRLLRKVGLYQDQQRTTIHDLRHAFAVKTLQKWYYQGHRVEAKLASLSTYLGHVSPSSTYWYLTATPELMACAADRLEKKMRGYL